MNEKVFLYGENRRGVGVLTFPERREGAPVVVLLNAGLLHRSEPYRLNVMVSRRLAKTGYIALRVDISGKGDTPAREGLTNRESVALDWSHIKAALKQQLGDRRYIIFGLCSGADNGIKIAAADPDVRGLILLDAVSPADGGFRRRALMRRLTRPSRWARLPRILWTRARRRLMPDSGLPTLPSNLRDEPRPEDLRRCFESLVRRQGRVLAIFTGYSVGSYNQVGQFARAIGVPGLAGICEEHFWPAVSHLYPVVDHRDRLVDCVNRWAGEHLERLRGGR